MKNILHIIQLCQGFGTLTELLKFSLILSCGLNISNSYATDYVSRASTGWGTSTTWTPNGVPSVGDNVTITGFTVTLGGSKTCENLTIDASGVLGKGGSTMIIRGNLINNGNMTGTGTVTFSVNAKTISGSGDFNTAASNTWNFNANTTILSGTTITRLGGICFIAAGVTVTNQGTLIVASGSGTGTLQYSAASAVFINDTDASLTLKTNLSTSGITAASGGTLNATASGNTITFVNATSYTITPTASTFTITSGTFHHLAVGGGGTKYLPSNLIINGDLTVGGDGTATTLNVKSYDLTVAGNWALNGSGSISNNTSNICTFNGATTLSGTNTFSFANVTITGGLTAPAANMNISGDFSNDGAFTHGNGTVTFNGTTTISGASEITFDNVTITGTLTAPAGNMNVEGDFNNAGGTFIHNSGTVTFTGNTTISGASTTSFNNITITGTLTAKSAANVNVAGDFANNGTFINNNGTLTFTGTTTVSGTGSTTFYNVTITGTLTGHSGTMNIARNFVNNGTFFHNSGTINFSGTAGISGTSTVSLNHLSIAGTRTAPAGNMDVAGNFTVTGTFTHNSGTVTFNGTSAQTIGGIAASITFNNLTVSNTTTVTTNLPLDITDAGTVTVDAGTFATGSNAITLLSTAGGTARIGNSAGSISGDNWIIQRHIPASSVGWNDVSTATNNNPPGTTSDNIVDWDNELYMSIGNSCPDGMAAGWYSVYYWNTGTQAWGEVTNCSEVLSTTRGYELWLATSSTSLWETTFDSRGTPNFGNKAASLASGIGNFSLIGNPFASGIDWDLVYAEATGISSSIQIYNEAISNYSVYTTGVLSANQGFWVENTGASPTLTFKEAHKSTTNNPLIRKMNPTDVLKIKLYSEGRKNACESVIQIQDDASEFFIPGTDVSYLKSRDTLTPSLTPVTADGRRVRVKSIPVRASLSVPVAATFGAAGEYKIDFSGADAIDKYDRIVLEDVEAGVFFPLKTQTSKVLPNRTYSFSQGKTAPALKEGNPQSPFRDLGQAGSKRKFILHFSNLQGFQNLAGLPIENSVHVSPVDEGVMIHFNFDEPTHSVISLYDVLGQEVLTRKVRTEKESITLPMEKNHQLYFVKITTAAGTSVKKIFR